MKIFVPCCFQLMFSETLLRLTDFNCLLDVKCFLKIIPLCSYQCHARRGGPRDRVGTLNVRVRPTWGILTNFDHTPV